MRVRAPPQLAVRVTWEWPLRYFGKSFSRGHFILGVKKIRTEEDRSKLEFLCEDKEEKLSLRLCFCEINRTRSIWFSCQDKNEVWGHDEGSQSDQVSIDYCWKSQFGEIICLDIPANEARSPKSSKIIWSVRISPTVCVGDGALLRRRFI